MERTRSVRVLGLAILFGVVAASPIFAGSIRLAWDPVVGAEGYRVHYGTSPGSYTRTLTVGRQSDAVLSGLADCTTWYMSVQSYNRHGSSGLSPEISGWPRPEVSSVDPSTVRQGDQLTMTLHGANFATGAELQLQDDSVPDDVSGNALIRVDSATVLDCRRIQAVFTIEPTSRGVRAMEVGDFMIGYDVENPDSVYGVSRRNLEVEFDLSRWDINVTGSETHERIDGADLSWLSFSYGSREGEPYYDPDADLNGDGIVDGEDLAYLASGFGRCWSGSGWTAAACD
jgi:hypothetical protein